MLWVEVGVRCGNVVEQLVNAAVGEAPAPMSTVGSRFRNACFVKFSKRLGDRVRR